MRVLVNYFIYKRYLFAR